MVKKCADIEMSEAAQHLCARARICPHGHFPIDCCFPCRNLIIGSGHDLIQNVRCHVRQDSADTYVGLYFSYVFRAPISNNVMKAWAHITLIGSTDSPTELPLKTKAQRERGMTKLRDMITTLWAKQCLYVLALASNGPRSIYDEEQNLHRVQLDIAVTSFLHANLLTMRQVASNTLKIQPPTGPIFHLSIDDVSEVTYFMEHTYDGLSTS